MNKLKPYIWIFIVTAIIAALATWYLVATNACPPDALCAPLRPPWQIFATIWATLFIIASAIYLVFKLILERVYR